MDDRRLERVQVTKAVCDVLDEGQTVCIGIQLKVLWGDPILVMLDHNAGAELLLESNSEELCNIWVAEPPEDVDFAIEPLRTVNSDLSKLNLVTVQATEQGRD